METVQILRERGTYAEIVAGGSYPPAIVDGQLGYATDRDRLVMRDGSNYYQTMMTTIAGTAESVPFLDSNKHLTEDNSHFSYSSINKRLTIHNIQLTTKLMHIGDDDSYWYYVENDHAEITIGGIELIDMQPESVIFNEGQSDVDFIVKTYNEEYAFYVDGSNGYVGVGTSSPSYTLDVAGSARIGTLGSQSVDTVVTHSSGVLGTRTIDSRVWGSTLVGGSGSAGYFPIWSDSNTLASSDLDRPGINWTARSSAADNDWVSVCYGNGLFVAVAQSGTGNRVMTSPDGINWTARSSAADNDWRSVCYGNGLFVAVAFTGTGNRVMTSPDGINWTSRSSAADNEWRSVCYGNGLFVAVAATGTGNRVMTSPDGINWTARGSAADNDWRSVCYGNGLFVAVAQSGTGNRVMTSPDGINWTARSSAADNNWISICYGNGLFVAVSYSGTGNRVMTSGRKLENEVVPLHNHYSGKLGHIPFFRNDSDLTYDDGQLYWDAANNRLGVGTTVPSSLLHLHYTASCGSTIVPVLLSNSNVSHGITDYLPNNAFLKITEYTHGSGGTVIAVACDSSHDVPISIYAGRPYTCGTSYPYIHLMAGQKSGTGLTTIGNDEVALKIDSYTTNLLTIKGNGNTSVAGCFSPKIFSSSTQPSTTDIPSSYFAFWRDTANSKLYLCYNYSGSIKKVELT